MSSIFFADFYHWNAILDAEGNFNNNIMQKGSCVFYYLLCLFLWAYVIYLELKYLTFFILNLLNCNIFGACVFIFVTQIHHAIGWVIFLPLKFSFLLKINFCQTFSLAYLICFNVDCDICVFSFSLGGLAFNRAYIFFWTRIRIPGQQVWLPRHYPTRGILVCAKPWLLLPGKEHSHALSDL